MDQDVVKGAVSWKSGKQSTPVYRWQTEINGQSFFKTAILDHRNHNSKCFWLCVAKIRMNADVFKISSCILDELRNN